MKTKLKLLLIIACSVIIQTGAAAVTKWPSTPLGGGEKFIYDEQTFVDARSRIDRYGWAADLYEKLRGRVMERGGDSPIKYTSILTEACWAEDAAIYYRISGDESVIPGIADMLVSYYRLDDLDTPLFPTDPQHNKTDFWMRIMQYDCRYLLAYDLVRNHPSISPLTTALEKRMDEVIAEGYLYDSSIGRLGNSHFFGVTGLGIFGFMRGDKAAVDRAINGPHGFKALLAAFRDDGQFWPEPKAYCYGYVDCCILMLAEAARFNNYEEDLYEYEDPVNGASIRKMARAFILSCTPEGYSVANGEHSEYAVRDGDRLEVERPPIFTKNTHRENTKLPVYYARLKDPVIGWAMSRFPANDEYCVQFWGHSALLYGADVTSIEPPSAESAVWQEMGDALIRSDETPSYWDGNPITVHFRNGASQQYHGDNDHMSIAINAYGKDVINHWFYPWDYLCPRRGCGNLTPLSQRIVNHNTVVVDMAEPDRSNIHLTKAKAERPGADFSEVRHSGPMKIVSASGSPYSGVRQQRTIGVVPEYVVDVFELESDDTHNYDYILHSNGDLSLSCKDGMDVTDRFNAEYGSGPIDVTSTRSGNIWISDAFQRTEPHPVKAVFRDSDGTGVVTYLLEEDGTVIIDARTPVYIEKAGLDATPQWCLDHKRSMFVARRKCSSTVYIAIHQPFEGNPPALSIKRKGDKLYIKGKGFNDRFDTGSMTFRRR